MYIRNLYCCSYCDATFSTEINCSFHEAVIHFRLSQENYEEWKRLTRAVVSASKRVNIYNHTDTRTDFDNAIKNLCDFEKEHHLEGKDLKGTL